MQHADEFKQKGIEQLVCVSVNDVFVMDAWGKSLAANDILMVVSAPFPVPATAVLPHAAQSTRNH